MSKQIEGNESRRHLLKGEFAEVSGSSSFRMLGLFLNKDRTVIQENCMEGYLIAQKRTVY
ncbi:hypothetical protein GIW82_08565 [Planomicrobium sp. YIM 101495]|nr:hypothetical protein [Planomicrobium sp. YIM 101495]